MQLLSRPPYQNRISTLYRTIDDIAKQIHVDFGGGCPLAKSMLMAYLIQEFKYQNYVEIGVYRGRSFFPLVRIIEQNGGKAYGVDPYDLNSAYEYELGNDLSNKVNKFLESLDFDQLYNETLLFSSENNLDTNSIILRSTSEKAIDYFIEQGISIDMLHIDGNHDEKFVKKDAELYMPLVREGGVVVFDDLSFPSVNKIYNKYKDEYTTIFNNGQYGILFKSKNKNDLPQLFIEKTQIINSIIEKVCSEPTCYKTNSTVNDLPKVSVVVTTYNHEKFVSECLEGIIAQKGLFYLELIIGDDFSSDQTLSVINSYIDLFKTCNIDFMIIPTSENIGVVKNLERCIKSCTGDFIAICEGDDFWVDCYKLQNGLVFLNQHPECSFCFNRIYIYNQNDNSVETFLPQNQLEDQTYNTKSLINFNFIGNFSCCMYRSEYIIDLPDELFETFTVDWMFNLYYSQFGEIGFVNKILSVYRKHNNGVWAGKSDARKASELYNYLDDYNMLLGYKFDKDILRKKEELSIIYPSLCNTEKFDLTIYDDVFPHKLSAFRYHEFISYLQNIEKLQIISSGFSIGCLGKDTLEDLFAEFKSENPKLANKLFYYSDDMSINTKLLYTVFLNNAYFIIQVAERNKIPIIFTLYPGGGFGLDNKNSDKMLRRVTSSPCFKKVIVTQTITYDYLIRKGFCKEDQIEFIYGVVSPVEKIENEYVGKLHYGFGKDTLDICFMAYKYTTRGEDKGYDTFIEVAKIISKKFSNVYFHVVGGFTINDIDVSIIGDRVIFYGARESDSLDDFFIDKDIILSPNMPGKIYEGSFDGFPTGACTEAALRETAIFCTDDLNLNVNFSNGSDLIITSHDPQEIANNIELFIGNPQRLIEICRNGRKRVQQLYSNEAQITPRLNMIYKEINEYKEISPLNYRYFSIILSSTFSKSLLTINQLIRPSHIQLKKCLIKVIEIIKRDPLLYKWIKRITPRFLKNILRS